MKKTIALAIALIMALTLAACGGNSNTPDGGNTAPPANTPSGNTNTLTPAPTPGSQPSETPSGGNSNTPSGTESTPAPAPSTPVDPNERGNTASNIVNRGIAAEKDGWIYYLARSRLHKMRLDGSDRQRIETGEFDRSPINVVGDRIYYHMASAIYSFRTDGSDKREIWHRDIGDNRLATNYDFTIIGDTIYVAGTEVTGGGQDMAGGGEGFVPNTYYIYALGTNGTDKRELFELPSGTASFMSVVDDRIYFYSEANNTRIIYSINIDGTDPLEIDIGTIVYTLCVDGGRIFYSVINGGIYSMNLDGTDRQKLHDDGTSHLNVTDGVIYYGTHNPSALYSMNADGSNRRLLDESENNFQHISVSGDWIFFVDSQNTTYMIRKDGTGREVLERLGD